MPFLVGEIQAIVSTKGKRNSVIKKVGLKVGEMAQWVKALAVLSRIQL